jgi:hypothetical protein
MFNWIREWYELKAYLAERKSVCNSCEVLKVELNRATQEKQMLLQKIFELTADTSTEEMQPAVAPAPVTIGNRHIPFRVRQQALEQTDREKAAIIQAFHKKNAEILKDGKVDVRTAASPTVSVEELEKTLGIVQGEV